MTHKIYARTSEKRKLSEKLNEKHFRQINLKATLYNNSYILPSKDPFKNGLCPGGVVNNRKEYIESSAWHEGKMACGYDFEDNQIIKKYDKIIYIGFFHNCWGHVITDNLKKLWYIYTDEFQELIKQGYKLGFISIRNIPLEQNTLRILQLAGINTSELIHITQISYVSSIVIPDNSLIYSTIEDIKLYTKEFSQVLNHIKSQIKPNYSFKTVYFTRTQLNDKRDYGEHEVEKIFEQNGYDIIAPEHYTVDEQIAILKGCEWFAATEGSVAHNSIFCSSDSNVVIIRKAYYINRTQTVINDIANLNLTYIDCHNSVRAKKDEEWLGPFYLYHNKYLNRFFHIKNEIKPLWLRKSWYRYRYPIIYNELHSFVFKTYTFITK